MVPQAPLWIYSIIPYKYSSLVFIGILEAWLTSYVNTLLDSIREFLYHWSYMDWYYSPELKYHNSHGCWRKYQSYHTYYTMSSAPTPGCTMWINFPWRLYAFLNTLPILFWKFINEIYQILRYGYRQNLIKLIFFRI